MTMTQTAPPLQPPMAGASPSPRKILGIVLLLTLAAVVFFLPLFVVLEITSYFRLSSPAQALRRSVMENAPGEWDKKIALNVGPVTCGLVRFASVFVHMDPEPRAAINSLHGGEVGIYRLQRPSAQRNYSAVFAAADKSMSKRGWQRIVGVVQHDKLVAVYAPRDVHGFNDMACCVAVLNDENLVIASGRGDVEPLLKLAEDKGMTFDHLVRH
jgi:hypothetical protein